MTRRRLQPALSRGISPSHIYDNPTLATVVTRSEAVSLWGRAGTTIDRAMLKGKLDYRLTQSGGTLLITTQSLIALWGEPTDKTLQRCYTGDTTLLPFEPLETEEKE